MEGYFGTFLIWADFLSFCFNNCSKYWRIDLATNMKILNWKFISNPLFGIAINNFIAALAYWFLEKSLKICPKNSLSGPTLASMAVVKFDGLPWPQKERYWAKNSYYYWAKLQITKLQFWWFCSQKKVYKYPTLVSRISLQARLSVQGGIFTKVKYAYSPE